MTPKEVEQVLDNDPVFLGDEFENGELRTRELGESDAGRLLFVVWTSRDGLIRPVTAWDANRRTREDWNKTRKPK